MVLAMVGLVVLVVHMGMVASDEGEQSVENRRQRGQKWITVISSTRLLKHERPRRFGSC